MRKGSSALLASADRIHDGWVNHHERQHGVGRHRQRSWRLLGFVGAASLAGSVLGSCGPDRNDVLARIAPVGVAAPGGSTVNGVLDEWRVRADESSVHAGPVTFTFENIGTTVHEMLVTRTDIAPG